MASRHRKNFPADNASNANNPPQLLAANACPRSARNYFNVTMRIKHKKAAFYSGFFVLNSVGTKENGGHEEIFIITSPVTISAAAPTRMALAGSPSTSMPSKKAPTAPMPVQMV